jgi:nitric oxide reductase activation protein
VAWLQRFDTPPQAEGPRALIAGLYPGSSSEAVSTALGTAQAALQARPEVTRLILYIHDGEPTDETPEEVAASVSRVRRAGLVVLGLYLGPQNRVARMEAMFGREWIIATGDRTRLPGLLGRLLKRFRVVA